MTTSTEQYLHTVHDADGVMLCAMSCDIRAAELAERPTLKGLDFRHYREPADVAAQLVNKPLSAVKWLDYQAWDYVRPLLLKSASLIQQAAPPRIGAPDAITLPAMDMPPWLAFQWLFHIERYDMISHQVAHRAAFKELYLAQQNDLPPAANDLPIRIEPWHIAYQHLSDRELTEAAEHYDAALHLMEKEASDREITRSMSLTKIKLMEICATLKIRTHKNINHATAI